MYYALTQTNWTVNTLNVKVKIHEIEQALLHWRFLSIEESAGAGSKWDILVYKESCD